MFKHVPAVPCTTIRYSGIWRHTRLWVFVALMALASLAKAELVLTEARLNPVEGAADSGSTVVLPYLWDRSQPAQSAVAEFVFNFDMPALAAEPYGLFAAKMANAYEVTVNGRHIEQFGSMRWPAWEDAKLPRIIPLGHTLRVGPNELRVRIRGDAGRQGGLSPLLIDTMPQAQDAYLDVWLWRVPARLGVVVFSALVGLMGLALWLTQVQQLPGQRPHRDRLYLYGGLAEFFWVFRVADSLIENPPLPVAWWSVLSSLSLGAWACLTTLFCMELVGWGQARWARAMRGWLGTLWVAGGFAAIAGWVYAQPLVLTVWYSLLGLTFLLFCVAFSYHSLFKRKDLGSRLLAFAIAANVVVGLADLYRLRLNPSITGSSALYFSSMLFGLAASVVVLMRFRAATAHAAHLQATLAQQVADKGLELEQSYAHMASLAQQQARSAERTRILRDMHDGVGMHISVALRQLQSGQAQTGDVVGMLQEGLDQLKLSIDALNLPPGDVTALLANVRYRLEPRLRSVGVTVYWLVEDAPLLPHLDDKAMRHLLFMVYEAISNVLQHARATTLHIEMVHIDGGSRIRLTDNGIGFDVTQPPRKGLQSMQERALAIGAELTLQSTPGQSVVTVWIAPQPNPQ